MNFKNIAQQRYTTKKYDGNQKINAEIIQELKEILSLTPSSINSQPWKFSIISSIDVKDQLAEQSYFNAQKIKDASHLIVFSGIDNIELFEELSIANAAEGSKIFYNNFIKTQPEEITKAWIKNQVYISLGFFLAACSTMHIDSTPMEGINQVEYDKIINPSGNYKSFFAVAIGKRSLDDTNQPSVTVKQRLSQEITIEEI